ncbi:MAG: hypothetical protein ABR537_05460 [Gemmatimonadales bacterium]
MRFGLRGARLLRLLRQNRPQELTQPEEDHLFERLRDAFRAALDAAAGPADLRALARQMREAVVDAKVAVSEVQDAVARTDRELAVERQRLADAERRGRLAGEIQDQETVTVAERFTAKHRERIGVLERKLSAQREELALAARELEEMQGQLKDAERARPAVDAGPGAIPDLDDELLRSDMDRAGREAAAARQLEELKKKMRKE